MWCDNHDAVKGANEWRHGWKAKGWRRGFEKSAEKNQSLANVDLWKAIDEALRSPRAAKIEIRWLKGYQGILDIGHADAFGEIGRQSQMLPEPNRDIDAEYRSVIARQRQ